MKISNNSTNTKTSSIQFRIIRSMLLVAIPWILIASIVSVVLHSAGVEETMKNTLTETSIISSERIEKELEAYTNIAQEFGSLARISNPSTTLEDKQALLDQKCSTYGFQRGNILSLNGDSIMDENNYADRAYFQTALEGETCVSEPIVSKATGEIVIVIAAPLWEGGTYGSKVVGAVYFVPSPQFLNDIIKTITISDNSESFIVNSEGTVIAAADDSLIQNKNFIEDAKNSDGDVSFGESIKDALTGNNGFSAYNYKNAKQFVSYAPIEGTSWCFAIKAPMTDFDASLQKSIYVSIAILIFSIIAAIFAARLSSTRIASPIKLCVERLRLLSNGDLKTPVPEVHANDETGILANSTKDIVDKLNVVIKDIDYSLDEMSAGNFNLSNRDEGIYQGDYYPILASIKKINGTLSGTLSNINHSAELVTSNSEQVASGAQLLSQGTTEQASSIEELAATINDISGKVSENAESAKVANECIIETGNQITKSNQKMNEMMSAMDNINAGSTEIGKIIKTIEDIAFQTNILALNAAVEAARAGSAGKGFAVVADEVRNLASKSAEASKNTAALIEGSLDNVKNGIIIAEETSKALEQVVKGAENLTTLMSHISRASDEQAVAVTQVTQGISQISSVIQTNSATAEESAAASQELSGQAIALKKLVNKFTLRPEDTVSSIDYRAPHTAISNNNIYIDSSGRDVSKY